MFASADQETMDMAQQQGLVRAADRQNFVRNALVVIAPIDAKAPPAALKDLAAPGVTRVALSTPASVPVALRPGMRWRPRACGDSGAAKAVNTERAPVARLRGAWRGGRGLCLCH